ncbi:hypothetical protein [Erysipelothrix piscisicarius]|uniref:hypothetical protein n=1 Tax=Erysipelothrix piscisicarius TaxID=2485784 RepID=UPI001E3658DF|nr:hypothetical protein [Erysipelothrix piscisicarius]
MIYGNFGAPRLGVLGGAIGTFIARCVELTFISYFLVTGNYAFKTRIRDMFDISKTKRITAKAFPLL